MFQLEKHPGFGIIHANKKSKKSRAR